MKCSVTSCMGTDKRPALALAGLACLAAALLSVCLGAAKISPAELLAALFNGGQTPGRGGLCAMSGFPEQQPASRRARRWRYPARSSNRCLRIRWLPPTSSG